MLSNYGQYPVLDNPYPERTAHYSPLPLVVRHVWKKMIKDLYSVSHGNSWISTTEAVRKQPKWAQTHTHTHKCRDIRYCDTDNLIANTDVLCWNNK